MQETVTAPHGGPRGRGGLVVLGDGLAEGRDDPAPDGGRAGWAVRLAGLLDLPRDRVAGFGVAGATISEAARVQLPAARGLRPALVLLGCGLRDVVNGVPADDLRGHLEEIFGWARSAGAVAIAAPVLRPPLLARTIVSESRRNATLERIHALNAGMRESARAHGGEFIEPEMLPRLGDGSAWSFDGIHPNAAGHAHLAEVTAEIARPLIEAPAAPAPG
ncbi:hypothetical protein GCM10023085_15180 [Actinomadura viridis]|uniref:Lysophospholipase L1-like esterase n=1 Tax=Actinomadura viridis TaxID=58110 RepID=A0A931GN23_9ACTN|nr:GDSL-type esterase/lipase family protein [Actinomadura viridis]MBG6093888.1 lysophospholipase L1-like esterase [Actinomadura viridis]